MKRTVFMPRFVFIGLDGYPSLIRVSSGVRLTPSFEGLFADPSLHLASSRPPELLPMSTPTPLFPVSSGFQTNMDGCDVGISGFNIGCRLW
ncbi:hypothetical protein HanRHA438_Chr11g0522141 [Helianthus annuus]|uniref:Uncharacterized protein n=1 Tax=Helianthus annuus TaxID=4232 RepID=A0A251TCI4_HELAN|nr:hypothetical protein HanXRQr2_Chr12g0528141 [Helianthus annuus]KAF5783604.1 hypothetical protein HanXRQr2_Chr11g0509861 [Helianthus annuus]KAJ0502888.1 hypothetical protein HanHA300_Chr11g0418061 [Helianthus annuus]KAJ0518853.1 hypothetical protein HanHA89_Chr11g0442091 [Helianthus annuus]KAJ0673992.1 hypothetical protein HanLR1_Chr12g0435071 [Helianthus annuus]